MTRPSLLSIGTFSNMTQLSAKALRLYAEQGILVPTRVDDETGYRYYRSEQVKEARLVRLLRELDMPLADIAHCMVQPALLEGPLKRHMELLSRRHAQMQDAYHAILAQLRPQPAAAVSIVTRTLPESMTAAAQFEAGSDTLAIRAHTLLAKLKIELGTRLEDGPPTIELSCPLSNQEDVVLELSAPVNGDAALPAGFAPHRRPARQVACVSVAFDAGATGWTAGSDALFDWFDRTGSVLDGTPLILMHDQAWELAWPIS